MASSDPQSGRTIKADARVLSILKEMVEKAPTDALPASAELALALHTSNRSVSSAMKRLESMGMVKRIAGKGTFVIRSGTGKAPSQTSAMRLMEALRRQMGEGRLPPGTPLPKFSYLAKTFRISPNTIRLAMKELHRQGLIAKRGKSWYAGGKESAWELGISPGNEELHGPVIIVVADSMHTWESQNVAERTRGFYEAFHKAAGFRGARIQLALSREVFAPQGLPAGIQQIERYISSLGKAFGGALLVNRPDRGGGGLEEWIRMLLPFEMPVIRFDDYRPTLGAHTDAALGKRVYHMYYDEEPGLRMAMSELYSLGHRRIGVVRPSRKGYGWMGERIERLEEAASRTADDLELICSYPTYGRSSLNYDALRRWVAGQVREGLAGHVEMDKSTSSFVLYSLYSLLGDFQELIRDTKVTALVFPNDDYAKRAYYALDILGIRIPKDLSLISFDNHPTLNSVPVSTVDFGFDTLGHLAAGLFTGSVGAEVARRGKIPGPCRLVRRPSLAPPRKGSLNVSFPGKPCK